MKKRKWKWIVFIAVLLPVLGIIGVRALVLSAGQRSLDAELERWAAIGGVTTAAELTPDPVPDDENAAILYRQAFDLLPGREDPIYDVLSKKPWEHPEQLADIVAANEQALSLLREAGTRPSCVWPTDYSQGIAVDLPYLGSSRSATHLLVAEAIVRSDQGDDQQAMRSLEAALQLARNVALGPLLINQLLQYGILQRVLSTYQRLFSDHPAPDDRFDAMLGQFDLASDFELALLGEGALAYFELHRTISSAAGGAPAGGPAAPGMAQQQPVLIGPMRWWMRAELASILRTFRLSVLELDHPSYEADFDSALPTGRLGSLFASMFVPAVGSAYDATAMIQSYILMAQTAMDLRRHKAEHGAYPEPGQYELPICPYDGKPIRYERNADGFRLWSSIPENRQAHWAWEQ